MHVCRMTSLLQILRTVHSRASDHECAPLRIFSPNCAGKQIILQLIPFKTFLTTRLVRSIKLKGRPRPLFNVSHFKLFVSRSRNHSAMNGLPFCVQILLSLVKIQRDFMQVCNKPPFNFR